MIFKDNIGNEYDITKWSSTDVTICGYFKGSINNVNEWLLANFGFNNRIMEIQDVKSGVKYYIGQFIELTPEFIHVFKNSLEHVYPSNKIIGEFWVDSFSGEIGVKINAVGRFHLHDILLDKKEIRNDKLEKLGL